jgi:hypothetical protein
MRSLYSRTLAESAYLDSQFGVVQILPRAGSSLEHPLVYDAAARELRVMAARGLIEIVQEHVTCSDDGPLIDSLHFRRVR